MVWTAFCVALTCFFILLHHKEAPDPEVPEIFSTWRALVWFMGFIAFALFLAGVYFSFYSKSAKKDELAGGSQKTKL
jgi:hypothetical protein